MKTYFILLPVLGKAETSAYLQVNSGSVGSYINHGKNEFIFDLALCLCLKQFAEITILKEFGLQFIRSVCILHKNWHFS